MDLTIAQIDGPQHYQMLATQGVLLGGDDLDGAIMRHRLAPVFGGDH